MNRDVKNAYISYLDSDHGAVNYNRFKEVLYGTPDSEVLRVFEILLPAFAGRKSISLLDVGGGDGKRLKLLIALFRVAGIIVHADLVEPSKAFTDDLGHSLNDHKLDLKIGVHHSLFENYKSDKTYDLIIFLHSFYTFTDDTYVKQIKLFLKPDGLLFMAGNAPGSFLANLKSILDKKHGGNRKESNDVIADLINAGFSVSCTESPTFFSNCLIDGNLSVNGKEVVAFLALTPFEKIDPGLVHEVIELIKQQIEDGSLVENEIYLQARLPEQVSQ